MKYLKTFEDVGDLLNTTKVYSDIEFLGIIDEIKDILYELEEVKGYNIKLNDSEEQDWK